MLKKFFYAIALISIIVGNISAQSLPAKGWISAYTNREGSSPSWTITNFTNDAISHSIFQLVKTDAQGVEFNLYYTKKMTLLNGAISVKFKANSGQEDQGGGIMWRVQDKNNYYIARYNPLENNLCLYYVKNAHRRLLNSATVLLDKEHWHSMKIIQHNTHYNAYLDSKNILQGNNTTFTNAGGIGVWTKADALTSFKDFKVTEEN